MSMNGSNSLEIPKRPNVKIILSGALAFPGLSRIYIGEGLCQKRHLLLQRVWSAELSQNV